MSLGNKYKDCGCGSSTSSRTYKGTPCCNGPVQAAPSPCCESHTIQYKAGVCLKPTCNVVADTQGFFLSFSNTCDDLPIDGNHVYFFHPATGKMRVTGYDGYAYRVSLVDETKAGGLIEKDSCVLIGFEDSSSASGGQQRCLSGNFTAPALNNNATIYIENGSSIPVGSTITFTASGETGSYQVISYVSSSGTVYAYSVQNTGSGHTPGTIISGGATGSCTVPIEIISNVDLCDLSTTYNADTITACLNGSPRGLKATGANDVIVGTEEGGWELKKLNTLDCCVVLDGCLKFSGDTCSGGEDQVVLRITGIDCFEEAWNKHYAVRQNMPMNIEGFPVVVTAYSSGTRLATFAPANADALDGNVIYTWAAGTQVCLGDCCTSCIKGSTYTKSQVTNDMPNNAMYGGSISGPGLYWSDAGKKHYLIGFAYGTTPLTLDYDELDATYDDNPGVGPGKPLITDNLVIRQKLCNTSESGCDQLLDLDFNYELAFTGIPENVRINYEFGHFATQSKYLADGTTPNPFNSLATQITSAGSITGPTNTDAQTTIGATAIGYGNSGNTKTFPYAAGSFRDYVFLEKCNCATSIVWLFVQAEALTGATGTGNFGIDFVLRQRIQTSNANQVDNPTNAYNAEDFA